MTTFEQLAASLNSKPFRGYYAKGLGGAMHSLDNLDLISHVTDNLYVGGCIGGADLGDFFSHVFSLYMWERYTVAPGTKVHTIKMYDTAEKPVDVQNVEGFAREIVAALEEGGNVLVHCQAGVNRSNLVATRVLMKWKGLTATEAIKLLREKRGDVVLANPVFENYLMELG
jgi:protein-tyrosine phosphatase